eukprot:361868-Chlamydomonas_euryale.AAC.2
MSKEAFGQFKARGGSTRGRGSPRAGCAVLRTADGDFEAYTRLPAPAPLCPHPRRARPKTLGMETLVAFLKANIRELEFGGPRTTNKRKNQPEEK